jgi:hypothetical protein
MNSSAEINPVLIYDTGALAAGERNEKLFLALHEQALWQKRLIVVPTPVLTQAWRDGTRQVRLVRLLRGCRLEAPGEEVAKHAGVLLGRSKTTDVVDAIVVATALSYHASIVTSDTKDLEHLSTVAKASVDPVLISI